jgi:hypothetical protein
MAILAIHVIAVLAPIAVDTLMLCPTFDHLSQALSTFLSFALPVSTGGYSTFFAFRYFWLVRTLFLLLFSFLLFALYGRDEFLIVPSIYVRPSILPCVGLA